jgi:hypothetical protein
MVFEPPALQVANGRSWRQFAEEEGATSPGSANASHVIDGYRWAA